MNRFSVIALILSILCSSAFAQEQVGEEASSKEDKSASSANVAPGQWKFVHLFYFKFKPDVSEEEIAGLMKELAGLKAKIPELQEMVVGNNVAPHTHGFQYGQISVFDKPEDLEVYEKHPEHQKLVRKIGPKLVHGVSVDFVPLVAADPAKSKSGKLDLQGKFIHAFSFKFKPDAPEEKVGQLMQELADSSEKIPFVHKFVVGKNVARNHHGFQFGEIAVLDDRESERKYQQHPEHKRLVPQIIPHMQMGLTFDFVPIQP
ncbi:MAG: Dabb family protein [Planctomycetota bacterium]